MSRSLLSNGLRVSDSSSFNQLRQVYTTSMQIQLEAASPAHSTPRIYGRNRTTSSRMTTRNIQVPSSRNDLQLHISLAGPPQSPTFSLSPPLTPHDPPER
ncbi:unnamed protein product [Meganyctiphanes norvegica]|uniref:Uncharacterized protein n=1 Tax=Meganyctiphanes norvegica TaxID=48144 RepID=A0AAV2RDD7_MEGNR